jgi:predicted ATPase
MLKEAGVHTSGALLAARRAPRTAAPAPVSVAPPEARPPEERRDRRVMVGREAEIALVTETFENGVRTCRGGLMLLRGAPGIGKTRLMNHLLELSREQNALVIRASAFEADAIRPFALWIDALRSLGGGHYEAIFGTSGDSNRERLFAGLSDFAAREAAARPLVLLFDDVHWCDESSAAALHYMLRMNRDRTLFAIATARDSELRDNTHMQLALRGMHRERMVTEVDLQPLPVADTAALIAAIVPGADAAALSIKSGGNPLLAIELARAEARGLMGSSLGDLVRDRLAHFGAVGGEVLRWAVRAPTLCRSPPRHPLPWPGACPGALQEAPSRARLPRGAGLVGPPR